MKTITTDKSILNETSELLSSYFRSISRYHIYSAEEQIELAKAYKNGDESAKDKLINSNLRFVVTCAKRYMGQGVALVDLVQAGNLGLIQSIKNFDPDKGIHFISFAVWYIRREILKTIYNNGKTIRYPVTHISRINKIRKAYDNFSSTDNFFSEDDLQKATDLTEEQYESAMHNRPSCQSMNATLEDGKTTIENILFEEPPAIDELAKYSIKDALRVLNKKEYKVISEFYGLDGIEKSVKEIAEEMGLGNERVRQLRKEGVKKLRRKCGNTLKTLL